MAKKKNNDLSAAAAELGAKGGKVGGVRRAQSLSAEERSEIARKAAKVRWQGEARKQRKKSQENHNMGKGKKPK